MPNALAFLMLIIWPLACVVMFRKLPFERAIIWSILGGYLILPPRANFDLPLVPSMDKVSIPSLCAALCCVYLIKRKFRLLPVSPVGPVAPLDVAVSPVGPVTAVSPVAPVMAVSGPGGATVTQPVGASQPMYTCPSSPTPSPSSSG